jgi:DNA invertase Pin-like site-specific DNA recombinase
LIFGVFVTVAEFELNLIQERTETGLTTTRARGRLGGQPKKLDAKKLS